MKLGFLLRLRYRRGSWCSLTWVVREDSVEPERQVPVALPEERHYGRDEQAADDRRVEEDRHRAADPELLRRDDRERGEGREHGHHDDRGAGDHASGVGDAAPDRLARVESIFVTL